MPASHVRSTATLYRAAYGSKVKAALDWQAKGSTVQIVSESDLYDAL